MARRGVVIALTGILLFGGVFILLPALAGLFAYSRNPIYVGYVAFLVGVFLLFGHVALLVYAALVAVVIHILIVNWEEPDLRRRFGREYDSYVQGVPRWLGLPRSRRSSTNTAE